MLKKERGRLADNHPRPRRQRHRRLAGRTALIRAGRRPGPDQFRPAAESHL